TAFCAVLLHEFKLGRTAKDAAASINVVWGEGTASERRFVAGFKSLEVETVTGRRRASWSTIVS
ncbi:hypothetical protein V3C99_014269, partial [Haemonchus contortus]